MICTYCSRAYQDTYCPNTFCPNSPSYHMHQTHQDYLPVPRVPAFSARPSSDIAIKLHYQKRAARNVVLKALAYPWRGPIGAWRTWTMGAVATTALLAALVADAPVVGFGLWTAAFGPWFFRSCHETAQQIKAVFTRALEEEIDSLADQDGVAP